MRGTVAKRIRREVYGRFGSSRARYYAQSQATVFKHPRYETEKKKEAPDIGKLRGFLHFIIASPSGTLVNTGKRREYLQRKQLYKGVDR